jgi:hypothetical protein
MTESTEAWEEIIHSRFKPRLEDAVRICKLTGVTEPPVLFELFEKMLHEWTDLHDYTNILE